jgi:hypothetical protein
MSEHLGPEPDRLDDQVAEIADQLMNQSFSEEHNATPDPELRGYLEMLTRLSQIAQRNPPDREMVERVRTQLANTWKTAGPNIVPGGQERIPGKHRASPVYQSTRQRQNLTLRFAFIMIFTVVLAAFFIMPTINHAIPGAAGGQADIILFLVIIISFCGFAAWWYFHHKG